MSIFSKVSKAKKAAEQHKETKAQQAQSESPKPAPYKHVPTHAARDALTSAPASFTVYEKHAKIAEYNKRTGLSRSTSDLSTFHTSHGRPPMPINRTVSDLSISSVMNQHGGSRGKARASPYAYTGPMPSHTSQRSLNIYNRSAPTSRANSRAPSLAARKRSPLATSKEEDASQLDKFERLSTHSASSSNHSESLIEMKQAKPRQLAATSAKQSPFDRPTIADINLLPVTKFSPKLPSATSTLVADPCSPTTSKPSESESQPSQPKKQIRFSLFGKRNSVAVH